MQRNTVHRAAAVVLTAVLLAAVGQGTAAAADPQWEAAVVADPQWEAAVLDATPR